MDIIYIVLIDELEKKTIIHSIIIIITIILLIAVFGIGMELLTLEMIEEEGPKAIRNSSNLLLEMIPCSLGSRIR